MDRDILRITLLVIGCLAMAAIYLWDRYQKNQEEESAQKRRRKVAIQLDDSDETTPAELDSELERLNDVMEEDELRASRSRIDNASAHNIDSEADEPELQPETKPTEKQPRLDIPDVIIQFSVVAPKDSPFFGSDIFDSARTLGLIFSDLGIFDYCDEQNPEKISFRMANMVEPGTFDSSSLEDFTTPGITFFLQLPQNEQAMEQFSTMYGTAERMTSMLDGELQDKTHSTVTKQTVEHIREEVAEYCRQIMLAKKRR